MLEVCERSPLYCPVYLGRLVKFWNNSATPQAIVLPNGCEVTIEANGERLYVLNDEHDTGFSHLGRVYFFQSTSNYYELLTDRVRTFFIRNLSI